MTIKLRDVKSAVKDLLEVMEKFNVGSKEVDDFVRNLMQSTIGRQLTVRKSGEDIIIPLVKKSTTRIFTSTIMLVLHRHYGA